MLVRARAFRAQAAPATPVVLLMGWFFVNITAVYPFANFVPAGAVILLAIVVCTNISCGVYGMVLSVCLGTGCQPQFGVRTRIPRCTIPGLYRT